MYVPEEGPGQLLHDLEKSAAPASGEAALPNVHHSGGRHRARAASASGLNGLNGSPPTSARFRGETELWQRAVHTDGGLLREGVMPSFTAERALLARVSLIQLFLHLITHLRPPNSQNSKTPSTSRTR